MKKMKAITLLILALLTPQSYLLATTIKLNLIQYADLASSKNKVNILISDKIEANEFYFFTDSNNPNITLDLFKKMIELKELKLSKYSDFYFVEKKEELKEFSNIPASLGSSPLDKSMISQIIEDNKNLYSLDLKTNSKDDISNVLALNDINSTYTKSNKIFFKASDKKYEDIKKHISSLDTSLKQVKLKLTIIETDLNKLKDRSIDVKSFLKSAHSELTQHLNLLTMPYSQSTNLISYEAPRFYGVLKFLDSKNISSVKSSPLLTAKSNTDVFFSVVKNIPYLTKNKQIKEDKQSEENSYSYKDVGLKVNLKPVILKDSVDIDLHLVLEDVLSEGLTPVVSKKELKSTYNVKYNEILVLSGLNKEVTFSDDFSIPILSKLWILGDLFKFETKKTSKTTLSLILEVIK